jgi:hypothetical protein
MTLPPPVGGAVTIRYCGTDQILGRTYANDYDMNDITLLLEIISNKLVNKIILLVLITLY